MIRARRIWVVSELYYPEETSTGHFLTGIAEGLARDLDVAVLCGQPSYASRGHKAPRRERRHGVDIYRCSATTLNKDLLPLRLVNLASISVSVFWQGVRRFRRGDCVIVVTNPPSLPFLVWAACRIRGARCLLLVHDVYPEVLIAAGATRPDSVMTGFIDRLNRRLYGGVDRIVVLGRDMKELVARKLVDGTSRITTITNFGDVDEVRPQAREDNVLLQELGISERFVVQYSGNIGRTHGIEDLLVAARMLEERDDTVFLFIGSGAKLAILEEASREPGGDNVIVLPRRPRAELADSLNACDLAIISFLPGMAGISVPSRMYNVLAAGKPILAVADEHSEIAILVREEGVGWVASPNDPQGIAQTVLEARARPERLREMGLRARSAAVRKYSREQIVQAYASLLERLA